MHVCFGDEMATEIVATASLMRVATPTNPYTRVAGVDAPGLRVLVLEKGPQK